MLLLLFYHSSIQCGNNIIEDGEECDGYNLGIDTCQSMHKLP